MPAPHLPALKPMEPPAVAARKSADPSSAVPGPKIELGTAAFVQTNCALFAAGFATFALLYCVQPLMPLFSRQFHVSAAGASLALSLTTGLLAVSMLVAGVLSEAWGRKPMMVASLMDAISPAIVLRHRKLGTLRCRRG